MVESFHERFMREALVEARVAFEAGEVPVGAVVVLNGEIVARGHNLVEQYDDPTAHAELLALREACRKLGERYLDGAVLYCTLEPCPYCAGATHLHRVRSLVYGARDEKLGAAGSCVDLFEPGLFVREIGVKSGVLEQECAAILQEFFLKRRG